MSKTGSTRFYVGGARNANALAASSDDQCQIFNLLTKFQRECCICVIHL